MMTWKYSGQWQWSDSARTFVSIVTVASLAGTAKPEKKNYPAKLMSVKSRKKAAVNRQKKTAQSAMRLDGLQNK